MISQGGFQQLISYVNDVHMVHGFMLHNLKTMVGRVHYSMQVLKFRLHANTKYIYQAIF